MKFLKIGRTFMIIAFVFWLLETWFFGWNLHPINSYEEIADQIASFIFFIGFVFYIIPAVYYYERIFE